MAKTSIRDAGTMARAKKGVVTVMDGCDVQEVWWHDGYRRTGFLADSRPIPAANSNTFAPGRVDEVSDAAGIEVSALETVEGMIGGKPERLSWRDYGSIVAAAYAIGGRDAAYLERIKQRVRLAHYFDGCTEDDIYWLYSALQDDEDLEQELWERADEKRKSNGVNAHEGCTACTS